MIKFFPFLLLTLFAIILHSQITGFEFTQDMQVNGKYETRRTIVSSDVLGLTHFTDGTRKKIDSEDEKNLMPIKCSDGIIRTYQGVYMLENQKAENGEKKRILNGDFIDFMRAKEPTLSPGQKILSARVCELANKSIFLFYTVGKYDSELADYQTPRLTVLKSSDNISYLQIVTTGLIQSRPYELSKSADHIRCDQPFQITRKESMYLLCQEKSDLVSNYYVYKLDVQNRKRVLIGKCENHYSNGVKTVCS